MTSRPPGCRLAHQGYRLCVRRKLRNNSILFGKLPNGGAQERAHCEPVKQNRGSLPAFGKALRMSFADDASMHCAAFTPSTWNDNALNVSRTNATRRAARDSVCIAIWPVASATFQGKSRELRVNYNSKPCSAQFKGIVRQGCSAGPRERSQSVSRTCPGRDSAVRVSPSTVLHGSQQSVVWSVHRGVATDLPIQVEVFLFSAASESGIEQPEPLRCKFLHAEHCSEQESCSLAIPAIECVNETYLKMVYLLQRQ